MNNKQLQIVTFEQAKKLEEIGFDWECNGRFVDNSNLPHYPINTLNWNHGAHENCYSAPTTALALKWLRDEKKIFVHVDIEVIYPKANENQTPTFDFCIFNQYETIKGIWGFQYKSNEEAESEGLDYALDYLLKEI